jgi:transcriptional regulator with XRE-family HTH domain
MHPAKWRKSNGLSQGDLAHRLGIASKGRVSNLERGIERWPTDLAIAMDRISQGAVPVSELRDDLHDVRVIRTVAEVGLSA